MFGGYLHVTYPVVLVHNKIRSLSVKSNFYFVMKPTATWFGRLKNRNLQLLTDIHIGSKVVSYRTLV